MSSPGPVARPTRSRATSARTNPRLRPPARPPVRSRLRAVPEHDPEPRGNAFVVLLVLVLAAGLVGLLVLNTAMQRSAFTLDELRDEAAALSIRRQVLDLQVEKLRSPDRLAEEATRLGMVQMAAPVFLRLSDGKVLGEPAPAVAGTGPQLVPPPPAPAPDESEAQNGGNQNGGNQNGGNQNNGNQNGGNQNGGNQNGGNQNGGNQNGGNQNGGNQNGGNQNGGPGGGTTSGGRG